MQNNNMQGGREILKGEQPTCNTNISPPSREPVVEALITSEPDREPNKLAETSLGTNSALFFSAQISSLADEQRQLVAGVVTANKFLQYSTLHDAMDELVKQGGWESVKALVCLLSEVLSDEGALTQLATGGDKHVTVYSICRALLKTAGATRLGFYENIKPECALSKAESREVWGLVRSLAKGDHGDIQIAAGARAILFERFAQLPLVGGALGFTLAASQLILGGNAGSAPRLLFLLIDLPWSFRSVLPFASVNSREFNLEEILGRSKCKE